MKKILLMIAALIAVSSASAQTKSFQKFYNSYNGREGYTTIEMSGKMLTMIKVDGEMVDKELGEVFSKVKKLQIVVVERNNDDFTADIRRIISSDDYELLTSVNDGGVNVQFYASNDDREFLMYVADDENSLILSIQSDKLTLNQVIQFTKIIKVT